MGWVGMGSADLSQRERNRQEEEAKRKFLRKGGGGVEIGLHRANQQRNERRWEEGYEMPCVLGEENFFYPFFFFLSFPTDRISLHLALASGPEARRPRCAPGTLVPGLDSGKE